MEECRLCLIHTPAESSISIHDNPQVLVQQIWTCCQLQVLKEDGLPNTICTLCKSKLQSFADFKVDCLKNDEKLKLRLAEIKTEEVLDDLKWEMNLNAKSHGCSAMEAAEKVIDAEMKSPSDDNIPKCDENRINDNAQVILRRGRYTRTYSENREVAPSKRKKKMSKEWVKENVFSNVQDAENAVLAENRWGYHYKNDTEEGIKKVYRCKNVKYRGEQCDAALCLLFLSPNDKIVLLRSSLQHTCNNIETKSTFSMSAEIKGKIKKLYADGLKPKGIIENLSKNNIPLPSKPQLGNLLKTFRNEKIEKSTIRVDELIKCLSENSSVPDEETKPFIISHELNEDESSLRFFMSSLMLLKKAIGASVLNCDSTCKIIWHRFTVFAVGTTDLDGLFHPFGIGLCTNDTMEDYQYILQSLKNGVENQFHSSFEPKRLVCDAAAIIHDAFLNVFGRDCIIIMCWTRVRRCIQKKIKQMFPKQLQEEILSDLDLLQLSNCPEVFEKASNFFIDKWSKFEEFIDYFKEEWILKNSNWYEGVAIRTPSTNNSLVSWNRILKDERTHRERLPVSKFLSNLNYWIETWSSNYKNDVYSFAHEPTITVDLWRKSYQWAMEKKTILQPINRDGFNIYLLPADDQDCVEEYDKSFNSFDEFKSKMFHTYWLTQIPDDDVWMNGSCYCPVSLKKNICMHLVGIAIVLNLVSVPPEIAQKGRTVKVLKRSVDAPIMSENI